MQPLPSERDIEPRVMYNYGANFNCEYQESSDVRHAACFYAYEAVLGVGSIVFPGEYFRISPFLLF